MDLGADELSENYALALRLHGTGADEAELAVRLGIDPTAVSSFLRLARAKLERIERESRTAAGGEPLTGRNSDRTDP